MDPHAKHQSSCHVEFCFFFSATSKLSDSLGVGPVRRTSFFFNKYPNIVSDKSSKTNIYKVVLFPPRFSGETSNHGNRAVVSSSAHSCVFALAETKDTHVTRHFRQMYISHKIPATTATDVTIYLSLPYTGSCN